MKKILLALALIVLATGCSSVGTAKNGNEYQIEKSAIRLVNGVHEGKYDILSTDQVKIWVTNDEYMVLLDTMPESNFKKEHIKGAVNFEMAPSEAKVLSPVRKERLEAILGPDKNRPIVVYCGYTSCERSHAGATQAIKLGYKNVYRYVGGIVAWKDAKNHLVSSK